MHNYQFPIASERLIYRQLKVEDQLQWQAFFVDNPYLHFVGVTESKSVEAHSKFWIDRQMKRYGETGIGILGAFRKSDKALIGNVGIIWREDVLGENLYEIGYSVIPSEWGKGYATEMVIRFREYFEEHQIDKQVVSIIHIDNIASQRVALNNGMTRGTQFEFHGSPCYLYYKVY